MNIPAITNIAFEIMGKTGIIGLWLGARMKVREQSPKMFSPKNYSCHMKYVEQPEITKTMM